MGETPFSRAWTRLLMLADDDIDPVVHALHAAASDAPEPVRQFLLAVSFSVEDERRRREAVVREVEAVDVDELGMGDDA